MRRSALTLLTAGALVLLAAAPRHARADGMPFAEVTATDLEVRATAQRAVVWLRDSTWEVHIQPVFDRAQGRAAWVVPWPSQPTIHPGNADLFDHLELVTTPVFVEYCTPPSEESGGCLADKAGDNGGAGQLDSASTSVTVWERGTVGQLDYVVLSAGDGDDLVGWLETNDFAVTSAAASAIAGYETEDQFFFVAQLSASADPAHAIDPVRFVLPDEVEGFYPLRLTGLAVPPGEALDLTLWVVYPEGPSGGWLPSSHPWELFDERPRDRDAFDTAVDDFFDSRTTDHLLLLYASNPDFQYDLLEHTRWRYDPQGWADVWISYEDLGVTPPLAWAPELDLMSANGTRIHRYQARMDAAAMGEDLVFGAASSSEIPVKDCFYFHSTGTCPSEDDGYVGCSVVRRLGGSSWFVLALAAFALLLLVGRLRRPG